MLDSFPCNIWSLKCALFKRGIAMSKSQELSVITTEGNSPNESKYFLKWFQLFIFYLSVDYIFNLLFYYNYILNLSSRKVIVNFQRTRMKYFRVF